MKTPTDLERAMDSTRTIGPTLSQFLDGDAVAFQLQSTEDLEIASDAINAIKNIAKDLDSAKKSATGPISEGLERIRSWFRPYERQLTEATVLWKGKILEYNAKQAAQKAEAQKTFTQALQAGDRDAAKEALMIFAPAPKIEGFSTRQEYDFTVEDITKVPARFLTVLSSEARAEAKLQVKDGKVPSIPGLKFFLKQSVRAIG